MPDELVNALRTVFQRYVAYLDAFGPEEGYLKKKVETELGTKMIHLKMRCSGLGSEWGKVYSSVFCWAIIILSFFARSHMLEYQFDSFPRSLSVTIRSFYNICF